MLDLLTSFLRESRPVWTRRQSRRNAYWLVGASRGRQDRSRRRVEVLATCVCVNSIALQIARFREPTEFAHPTPLVAGSRLPDGAHGCRLDSLTA
jgi:hypothetical protein